MTPLCTKLHVSIYPQSHGAQFRNFGEFSSISRQILPIQTRGLSRSELSSFVKFNTATKVISFNMVKLIFEINVIKVRHWAPREFAFLFVAPLRCPFQKHLENNNFSIFIWIWIWILLITPMPISCHILVELMKH